jgi:hypothetical protein
MTPNQLCPADLIASFEATLRRQMSAETELARRLAVAGELRRQVSAVLRLAPYGGTNLDEQERVRSMISTSLDAAYFTVLSEAVQQDSKRLAS